MKLSEYIANFIYSQGIRYVFVLQGGAALHLIDSVERHENIEVIPMQHEQSSAFSADAYSKAIDLPGVTISTSGPGATNLVTGIASSYFDSVPTVHITGNTASFRQSEMMGVRQYGFQETDIVTMVKPITKFSVKLTRPEDIVRVLPLAFSIAKTGRRGPVLIDIPDDFQRQQLDNKTLVYDVVYTDSQEIRKGLPYKELSDRIRVSTSPIFILGAGLLNSSIVNCKKYFQSIDVPFLITWPLKGVFSDCKNNIGTFGTHSSRANNIVLQNADLIISVGCRLDSRATGKVDLFAKRAAICMVDIDENEIDKFCALGRTIDYKFNISADEFFNYMAALNEWGDIGIWRQYISKMKSRYDSVPVYSSGGLNPYCATQYLFKKINYEYIVLDTGTSLPLALVYANEERSRYISSFNNTPMGYALPASIGCSLATGKPVLCITGDGGMQMNVQELATINNLKLPIIIVVYNNNGHCMIKQTQDDWLDGKYFSSDQLHGLPSLDFCKISESYGIQSININSVEDIHELVVSDVELPLLIQLNISPDFRYEPIIKYGNPLDVMSPVLDHDVVCFEDFI